MSLPMFEAELRQAAAATDRWLGQYFDEREKKLPLHGTRLLEAMRYSVLSPGKRFRAFLVLASARLFDVKPAAAVPVAAAVECLHAFSLIHDDLPAMDDSPLRRGKPSVHVAFDEALAILAGDALQTEAFAIIGGAEDALPDATLRCALINGLASASGASGMVLGQAMDILDSPQTDVVTLQQLKTGALIAYCCTSGGLLGAADRSQQKALRQYGDCIGSIFQIADDILDVTASSDTLGKHSGQDAGKNTFVRALGLDGARQRAHDLEQQAHATLSHLPGDTGLLQQAATYARTRSH